MTSFSGGTSARSYTPPMADDMVERVAQAIFEKYPWPHDYSTEDGLPDVFREFARAAIAAMREPTEAMLQPACDKHVPGKSMGPNWRTGEDTGEECPRYGTRRRIWGSMIDAALSDGSHGEISDTPQSQPPSPASAPP